MSKETIGLDLGLGFCLILAVMIGIPVLMVFTAVVLAKTFGDWYFLPSLIVMITAIVTWKGVE